MRLEEIQTRFLRLVAGEAGEPQTLLAPVARGASAQRRLELYREACFSKAAEELRLSYPMTAALLGLTRFLEAVEPFLAAPVDGHQTREGLVAGLPEFLRGPAGIGGRPDLADLADLERARSQVAEEAGGEPVGAERLAGLEAQELATVRLRLTPALRLVPLAFDVFALWSALHEGADAPAPRAGPSTLLVWRQGFHVFHSPLGGCESEALRRTLAGAPLAEACACFLADSQAADSAYAALHAWFADGLVTALEHDSGSS